MIEQPEYPMRQSLGPQKEYLSACEAVTWIAFGRTETTEDLRQSGLELISAWGDSNFQATLIALEAAASEFPFCAVVRPDANRPDVYATRVLSPNGPAVLRSIQAQAERRTGILPSFADLAAKLRIVLADIERDAALLARARRDLVEAIRARRITASGRKSRRVGGTETGAHEEVPFRVLIDPYMTVTTWNTVAGDLEADLIEVKALRGTEYVDVLFATADILELWPVTDDSGRLHKFADESRRAAPIDLRPAATPAALREWMRQRVMNWPHHLPAPSEKRDWEAARAFFADGLRRDTDFRPIREQETPQTWQTRGPRQIWGRVLIQR